MHFKWRTFGCCCTSTTPANTTTSTSAGPISCEPALVRDLHRSSASFWSTTYDRTVRTQSYNQFMMKMDMLSSSPFRSGAVGDLDIPLLVDRLLQPSQSTVENVLRDHSGSERPDIIRIAADYFDSNERASHLCGTLLHSINEARTKSRDIERTLLRMLQPGGADQTAGTFLHQYMQTDIDSLWKLTSTRNPFGDNAAAGRMFVDVGERYNMISEEVEKRRRLVGREVRVLKRWKRGCIVGIVVGVVAGMVIIAVVTVVTHAVAASAGAPIVAAMATRRVHYHKQNQRSDGGGGGGKDGKEKAKWGRRRYKRELGVLRMQEGKLEAVARGSFTVRRMLDTLRCLVAGLQEDVERERRLVEFGWAHREERVYVQQLTCHLHRCHLHLSQHLDNLEEQIFVCFLIINKARDWLLQEFDSPSPP